MTADEIKDQIIQKMEELIDLYLSYVVIDNYRDREIDNQLIGELAELRRQLEKSKETKLSLPLDVPSEEEIENKFPYAVSYANMCSQTGAKWAIKQIIERNQK